MPDDSAMYRKLFQAQADAIDGLKEITDSLIQAHREVEEMYMNAPEHEILILKMRNDSTASDSSKGDSTKRPRTQLASAAGFYGS